MNRNVVKKQSLKKIKINPDYEVRNPVEDYFYNKNKMKKPKSPPRKKIIIKSEKNNFFEKCKKQNLIEKKKQLLEKKKLLLFKKRKSNTKKPNNLLKQLSHKKDFLLKQRNTELFIINQKKKKIRLLQNKLQKEKENELINDIKKEERLISRLKYEQKKLDKLEHLYKYNQPKIIKSKTKPKRLSRKYTVDGLPIKFKIKKRKFEYSKEFNEELWIYDKECFNLISLDIKNNDDEFVDKHFLDNNKITIKDMRFILKQDNIIKNKDCLSNKMVKILYKTFYFEDDIFIV